MKIKTHVYYFYVSFRKFAINNKKRINKIIAGFLTIITLFSALPLFSDSWRNIFLAYFSKFVMGMPRFLAYFYEPRAFIFYIIGLFLWMRLVYYNYSMRFLELALEHKLEIAKELPKIIKACPSNHYLGLIVGKLNGKALEIKDRRGADIISTIDKNIKKYERVYWVSEMKLVLFFMKSKQKMKVILLNSL